MASGDDFDDQSLLNGSNTELSNVQIRRRLTQEFNFDCGPVNNSTRKVLLKKLERLENERNTLKDSFNGTPTTEEEEKEKKDSLENNNLNGKSDDNADKSLDLQNDDEDLIDMQSTLNESPKKLTPIKKSESPTKVKQRKSVRINENITEITTTITPRKQVVKSTSSPTYSDDEFETSFKRPLCRPPIRRLTGTISDLNDSKESKRSSRAISPYSLISIAVIVAFLVIIYMYFMSSH